MLTPTCGLTLNGYHLVVHLLAAKLPSKLSLFRFSADYRIYCRIIDSRNDKYPIGKYVLAFFGWRTHTVSSGEAPPHVNFPPPQVLPDFDGLPISLGLGVLGRPGYASLRN